MTNLMGNRLKGSMNKDKTVVVIADTARPEVDSKHVSDSMKHNEHSPKSNIDDPTPSREVDKRDKEPKDASHMVSLDHKVVMSTADIDAMNSGTTSNGYRNALNVTEMNAEKDVEIKAHKCQTGNEMTKSSTGNGDRIDLSKEGNTVTEPKSVSKISQDLNCKSEASHDSIDGLKGTSRRNVFTQQRGDEMNAKVDMDKQVLYLNKTVPSTKTVHNFPCEYDNNVSRPVELVTVETLKQLIDTLKPDEINLSDKLASITKIVRGHSGHPHSELFIAAMISQGFTHKFERYLNVNGISVISELESSEVIDGGKKYWPTVKRFLMLLWITCDESVNFCQHTLTSNILQTLQTNLKRLCFLKYADSEIQTFTVKAILGILHNICRHVPNGKWKLRNDGLVSVVRLYLESEIPMVRLKSLVILSYILSEAENEMINSEDDNFAFIFKVLGDAIHSATHKSSKYGMGVVEVLKGLNNLAINDENKIRIVRNGGLPLFQEILEEGSLDEVKVTITTLWSLAFHHYNKVKMREMPKVMSKLYEFQHCRDEEICHAARGTFWELENISKSSIGSSVSSSLSADKDPSQPHIMISYQWDSQAVMMKVKDRLRQAGYKVWMDIEHMTGSTLEAMALAVEKAAVVLVCMSQKYKDSPNCRTEAEYVYRLRKDFVPLRLQREYIPDGWLGILVGTRLYFDVYLEDQLDVQVPRLIKELRDRGKISPMLDQQDHFRIVPQRMTSREAVPILHHPASPTVTSWSPLDVKHWLTSIGLCDFVQNFDDIDGHSVLELQKIQETAPEYFHTILHNDFNLTVTEALKLSRNLRLLS